jgi:hypothetical protein
MAHDVFISYSSLDSTIAEAVCSSLEAGSVRCWMAPRDIPAGASYPTEIIQAIKTAPVMIVIVSSHANSSPHVANEVERAVNGQVAVIPFRIESVEPSDELQYFLARRHWMDALSPPLEPHLERLTHAVRAILSAPPAVNTAPQPQRTPIVARGETLYPVAGEDVHLELALTATEAAQGGKRYVTAAGRSVKIDVPMGVHDGAQSRYPGGGLPSRTGGEAGALVITFRVVPAAPDVLNHGPVPVPPAATPLWITICIAAVVILGILFLLGHIGMFNSH